MYDLRDERGVPISAGVPMLVRVSAILGVIAIFVIIGLVAGNSSFGHAWPSGSSTKIPL